MIELDNDNDNENVKKAVMEHATIGLDNNSAHVLIREKCKRCNGNGHYLRENEFDEMVEVRCFVCEGKKYIERWAPLSEFIDEHGKIRFEKI